jgi:GntR family transcriptional repressor for pyruvate dehydrogenase complex
MGNIRFKQIRTRRLSEVIENHLRELILSGEVRPGDKLPNEKELSKQFGVSLVTVREGLKGLESLGLIEKKPGKGGGIFISDLSNDSLKMALHRFLSTKKVSYRDIGELRVILEPVSIRKAAAKITPSEITKLEKNMLVCDQIIHDAPDPLTERTFIEFEERNIEFHTIIAQASGNPLLAFAIESEIGLLFPLKKDVLAFEIGYLRQALTGHRNIVKYLKIKDAVKAQTQMSKHITLLETYLLSKGINIEGV